MQETAMTSTRPYLLRAFFDWIIDNNLTPYLVVDANVEHVQVPVQYVHEDGSIILNVSPIAVQALVLENDYIEFNARFAGNAMHIYVPIHAVNAIYAKENGRGIVFTEEEEGGDMTAPTPIGASPLHEVPPLSESNSPTDKPPSGGGGGNKPPKRGKPNLKIVK